MGSILTTESRLPKSLWEIAEELSLTPQYGSKPTYTASTRSALNEATASYRGRRRLRWFIFGAGIVCLCCGVLLVLRGNANLSKVWGSTFILFGVALGVVSLLQLISASAYRSLSRFGATILPIAWATTFIVVVLTALASLAISIVAFTPETSSPGASTLIAAGAAVTAGFVSIMFALVCSTLVSPIISTGKRTHHYQVSLSQFGWSISLIASILSLVAVVSAMTKSDLVLGFSLSTGVGLLTATVAWHARFGSQIRSARKEALALLADAISSTRENDTNALRRSVLTMLDEFEVDPFRSSAPATPPLIAGWGIVQVLQLVLNSIDADSEGKFNRPTAIVERAELDGGVGKYFTSVKALSSVAINSMRLEFFEKCRVRLLSNAKE
ncbi:MAG: hypothetical protein QM607_02730 [Microbacterium sp.]